MSSYRVASGVAAVVLVTWQLGQAAKAKDFSCANAVCEDRHRQGTEITDQNQTMTGQELHQANETGRVPEWLSAVARDARFDSGKWDAALETIGMDLDTSVTIERTEFHLSKTLGAGVNAVAFLLESNSSNKLVVKVPKTPRGLSLVKNEINIIQELHSKVAHGSLFMNVVPDAPNQFFGVPAVFLEFIEGWTLSTWWDAYGRAKPVEQVMRMVCQTHMAIREMVAADVGNTDQSKLNIMVTPAGDIRLIDFGEAKQLPQNGFLYKTKAKKLVEGTVASAFGEATGWRSLQALPHEVDAVAADIEMHSVTGLAVKRSRCME